MPDPIIDRVRASDPVRPGEFDGLGDFDALRLEPRRAPRRRRLLALPAVALAAAVAAVAVLPASAPQAKEVLRRASVAMAVDGGGILYAETSVHATYGDYGTRRVWVAGPTVRFLQVTGTGDAPAGSQEISRDGVITRYAPDGRKLMSDRGQIVPGDIFRSAALVDAARAGRSVDLEETTLDGRPAYALSWEEPSFPAHHPKIEMTLWVDRETYVPLRFTDHSYGLDAKGKPFDQTLTETVNDFKRLPDTPENRRLLEVNAPRD